MQAKWLSLIDLLEMFPACARPFNVYLEWLRPRYYSIVSSPLADAHKCAITVALVDAPAGLARGRYQGTCSSYLQQQPEHNAIYAFTPSPQMAFRPPEDPATPIIVVGPGGPESCHSAGSSRSARHSKPKGRSWASRCCSSAAAVQTISSTTRSWIPGSCRA
jgi:hypothetical protein